MAETLKAFGREEKISKKILIIGGGNIGFNLAKNIEETFVSEELLLTKKREMKICKIILFMVVFTTSFGQQQINKTLFFDGQNRSYIVYIPASYNANSSTPILFNFHGGGGTCACWASPPASSAPCPAPVVAPHCCGSSR